MNLPNQLTVSRFAITVLFVAVVLVDWRWSTSLGALLFLVGGLTDIADGYIARKRNLQTDFGKLMDPLADKILVTAGFIVLVGMEMKMKPEELGSYKLLSEAFAAPGLPGHPLMPAWMVIIIVARELAITGLRLLAANKQVVLSADNIGKSKTVFQITSIISMLVLISYPEWGEGWNQFFGWKIAGVPWGVGFVFFVTWGAVVLTLVSGANYLWSNRAVYLKDM